MTDLNIQIKAKPNKVCIKKKIFRISLFTVALAAMYGFGTIYETKSLSDNSYAIQSVSEKREEGKGGIRGDTGGGMGGETPSRNYKIGYYGPAGYGTEGEGHIGWNIWGWEKYGPAGYGTECEGHR